MIQFLSFSKSNIHFRNFANRQTKTESQLTIAVHLKTSRIYTKKPLPNQRMGNRHTGTSPSKNVLHLLTVQVKEQFLNKYTGHRINLSFKKNTLSLTYLNQLHEIKYTRKLVIQRTLKTNSDNFFFKLKRKKIRVSFKITGENYVYESTKY